MEQYEIVINPKGYFVPSQAPRMTFFQPPAKGRFTEHHIFFNCETPTQSFMDRTVIPMKGMFGYLFNEKVYTELYPHFYEYLHIHNHVLKKDYNPIHVLLLHLLGGCVLRQQCNFKFELVMTSGHF